MFPPVDYADVMVDCRAESDLVASITGDVGVKDKEAHLHVDEVMVARYPPGRHGLTPRTRPTAPPHAAENAFKAQRANLRAKRSQQKLILSATKNSLTACKETGPAPSQVDMALQWKHRQQNKGARNGTQISIAAGVGSARDLSACLGSHFDLSKIRDAALAQVSE